MRYPGLFSVGMVVGTALRTERQMPDGSYHAVRPLGFQSFWHRCRCVWLVFTGRADALIWPGGQ